MSFQIQGNVVATNARLRLVAIPYAQPYSLNTPFIAYSSATGAYSFTNVPAGTYQIIADLLECVTAPYSSGYSYRSNVTVTMDAAGDNLVDVNLTPVLLNAVNPVTNQR
jgi:hypothetical protein